jgi:hypothetical protein
MALLFSYALVQPCQSQEKHFTAGVNLTSFLQNSVEVSVSYGFAEHWSITGETDVSYKGIMRKESSAEQKHEGEFINNTMLPQSADLHCERIIFSFWPVRTLDGIHFSAGVQSGSSSGTDIITAAGYSFEVWRSLHMSASIQIPILEGIREKNISTRNIKVGIQYRF